MTIGQRLATARQHGNLTQDNVAAKLHVTRQTVSSWENERTYPDITNLVALSSLYQLSLDDLIREDADMVKAWQSKEAALRDAAIMMRVSLLLDVGFLLFLLAHEMKVPGFATSHGVGLLIVLMTLTNALAMPRIGRYYRVLRGKTAKRNVWKGVILVVGLVAVTGLLGWTQYSNSSVVLAGGYAVAMVVLFSPRREQGR